MRAASMSSPGSSEMKLCSRKMPIGSEKHTWANHTVAKRCAPMSSGAGMTTVSPMLTPSENRRSSGTSAICSGTICRAKMPMKIQFAPRKGIHAMAYAANAARASANSTVGTVITTEFRKYPASCPEPADSLNSTSL